jgi:hypothetical protein
MALIPYVLSKVLDQIPVGCNWAQYAGIADKKLCCDPFLLNALAHFQVLTKWTQIIHMNQCANELRAVH